MFPFVRRSTPFRHDDFRLECLGDSGFQRKVSGIGFGDQGSGFQGIRTAV